MKNFFSVGLLFLVASTFAQQTNQIEETGNVGIGTTTPNSKLEVHGDIALKYGNSLKVHTNWNGNGNDKILQTGWDASRGNFLDLFVPGDGASNDAKISFRQNGKVGIGITQPYEKLDINGVTYLRNGAINETKEQLRLGRLDLNVRYHSVYSHHSTTANNNKLVFKMHTGSTSNATEQTDVMSLNGDGNVGIGTVSPEEKLHVKMASTDFRTFDYGTEIVTGQAGSWARSYRLRNSNDGSITAFGALNGDAYIATNFNKDTDPTGYAARKLVINSQGNVGIGTTSPSSKLNIRSQVAPTNTYPPNERNDYYKIKDYDLLYLQQDGHSNIGPSIFMKGFNNGTSFSGRISLVESGGANGDITFLTSTANGYNQNEVMRVTSKSTVGIGTKDTKGFKLGVKGKIAAEEVKVATYANWADFVFKKEYDLPTLEEVATHIKEKGHLKDIPSAKEVEKNGFYLGQMDAKLLQKIEELTLYTIEQEKQIQELKEEVKVSKQQAKEIEKLKEEVKELGKLKEEVKELGKLKELIKQLLKKNTK